MQSERHLLTVMRYMEINPVRAAVVHGPENYRWSNLNTHLARARDPLITPRPRKFALEHDHADRASAWKPCLDAGIAPQDLRHLRAYASQERALVDKRLQRVMATT